MHRSFFLCFMIFLSFSPVVVSGRYQLDYSIVIDEFIMLPNDALGLDDGVNVTGYFESRVEFLNSTQIGVFNSSSIMTFGVGSEVNSTSFPGLLIFSGYTDFLDEKTLVPVKIFFDFILLEGGGRVVYPAFNFTLPSDFLDDSGQCLGTPKDVLDACERSFSFSYWNVTAEFSTRFTEVSPPSSGSWLPLLLVLGIPVLLIFVLVKAINNSDRN
ncbi:MAG: hypothetical protein D6732_17085 [Methanobacteriota archaeon]|nr:MAG: hypothetical protein D6732_17085 [Euryarchaeota archaeon]